LPAGVSGGRSLGLRGDAARVIAGSAQKKLVDKRLLH
jgi:hypothetical protein